MARYYPNKFQKRDKETRTFKEAFDSLLNSYRLDQKYKETEIISSWEEVMGTPIARRTQKIFIRNKKLFLSVDSAALKQELFNSRGKIIEIYTKRFGEIVIEDVVFI